MVRANLKHLPMATLAFFVDGSHRFSQGFASEHFLSQRIGHAVVQILGDSDKKGYAKMIGGSIGVNIDLVDIVGAVGALIRAGAAQNSFLEPLRVNKLVLPIHVEISEA